MKPLPPDQAKKLTTAMAVCAIAGIVVTPSHDDCGRRTVILTRGAWTREVPIEQLASALAEMRAMEAVA